MRKRCLILIAFLVVVAGIPSINAQDGDNDAIDIVARSSLEKPDGYVTDYSQTDWSPFGSMVAVSFGNAEGINTPQITLWQLYDVETGALLREFYHLIDWYVDDEHVLVQDDPESPPIIYNARTNIVEGTLENAGTMFADGLISTVIANLDESNTLHLYDAQTGVNRLTIENVADLPQFSPDDLWLAVNVIDSGIKVYNTDDLSVEYTVDGFRIDKWSPDSRQMSVVPLDNTHVLLGPHHIWTLDTGLSAPIYNVTDRLIWSPDGSRIAAIIDYEKVRIFDSVSGDLLQTIWGYPSGPSRLNSWESNYLVVSSGDHGYFIPPVMTIWNTETWDREFQEIVDYPILWFDNHILTIIEPLIEIRHIDLQTGAVLDDFPLDSVMPFNSPDFKWVLGTIYAVEDDGAGAIHVLHVPSKTFMVFPLEDGESPYSIFWSPDSRHFASVNRPNTITIWEIVYESE